MAVQVKAEVSGTDLYYNALGVFNGSPLQGRLNTLLSEYDQVIDLALTERSGVGSILTGSYPWFATLTLGQKSQPMTLEAVRERIRLAVLQATTYPPTSLSVVSLGEPSITPPARGVGDTLSELPDDIARAFQTLTKSTEIIIVALALGILALIYFAAKNPKQARALV